MDRTTSGDTERARVRNGLKLWFREPPRRHGEVLYSREVGFLELFYDLVYVVVIGRAAHHLAEHVDWIGVRDFALVFGLIWLAWFNGTFWHELHAREAQPLGLGVERGTLRLPLGGELILEVVEEPVPAHSARVEHITPIRSRVIHRSPRPDFSESSPCVLLSPKTSPCRDRHPWQ